MSNGRSKSIQGNKGNKKLGKKRKSSAIPVLRYAIAPKAFARSVPLGTAEMDRLETICVSIRGTLELANITSK